MLPNLATLCIGMPPRKRRSELNETEAIAVVSRYGPELEKLSDEMKNTPAVVKAAVMQDGDALQYASKELRNNEDIVKKAVTQNPFALQYASEDRKNDKNIVLRAVQGEGTALLNASKNLKNDFDVVMEAVKHSADGRALLSAGKDLRNDPDLYPKLLLAAIEKGDPRVLNVDMTQEGKLVPQNKELPEEVLNAFNAAVQKMEEGDKEQLEKEDNKIRYGMSK